MTVGVSRGNRFLGASALHVSGTVLVDGYEKTLMGVEVKEFSGNRRSSSVNTTHSHSFHFPPLATWINSTSLYSTYFRFTSLLHSHVFLGLPSDLFSSRFPINLTSLYSTYFRFTSLLHSHVFLGLPSDLFPSRFPINLTSLYSTYFRFTSLLHSHVFLGLPSDLFPSRFPINSTSLYSTYFRFTSLLHPHVFLGLPSDLFPSRFPINSLYALLSLASHMLC